MAKPGKATDPRLTDTPPEDGGGSEGVRKNKKGKKTEPQKSNTMLYLLLGGGAAALLLLCLCSGGAVGGYFLFFRSNPVTKENFDKIKAGMTEAEVKDLLGRPHKTSPAFITADAKMWVWEHDNDAIHVTFIDGKVVAWDAIIATRVYQQAEMSRFLPDQKKK